MMIMIMMMMKRILSDDADADDNDVNVESDVSLGQWAVERVLLPEYDRKGHIISMDNYFMSASLLTRLLKRGFHACGTTRANRKGQPSSKTLSFLSNRRGAL